MKKLLTLLFAIALTCSLSFAQAAGTGTDEKKETPKTEKKEKKAAKKAAKKEKKEQKKDETAK